MTIPAVAHKSESLYFTENEREWVRLKWSLIRSAMRRSDQEMRKWEKLNAEIKDHMDRHNITDMVQRAKISGESIPLADALSTGGWFRAMAQAHMDDLNLFLRLKELGLL